MNGRTDFITTHLAVRYQACQRPAARRAAQRRWQSYEALAGRSLEDVAATLDDTSHPAHNDVARALLRSHRDHSGGADSDEIVLLLNACRRIVIILDPRDRGRDSRAHLWALLARRLATIDPSTIGVHNSRAPFLLAVLSMLRRDRHKSLTALNRPGGHTDLLDLRGNLDATAPGDVANQAIARCYLHDASQQRGWTHLARYTAGADVSRATVMRTRRRIAEAIGYVA